MGNVKRSVGTAFILRVVGVGVTYLFVIAMARIMRVEDFGTMGTVISAALLVSVIGSFGQRLALLRFVPPLLKQDQPVQPLASRAFSLAVKGNAVLYLCMVLGVCIAMLMGAENVSFALVLGLLIVPLTGVINMLSHLSLGHRNVVLALLHKDILWRLVSGGVLLALFFVGGQSDLSLWVVFGVLVAVLLGLIGDQARRLSRLVGFQPLKLLLHKRSSEPFTDEMTWRGARVDFWITSIASVLFSNFDVVVVGLVVGPAEAALYFAANRIAMILSMFQQSVGVVAAPLMAEHASAGDRIKLRQVVYGAVLQTMLPASAAAVGLLALDEMILGLFGDQFTAAIPYLWVLVLGRLVAMSLGSGGQLLTMAGEERRARWLSLISLGLGAVLIFSGVWIGGALGVAWATVVSLTLRKILYWVPCARTIGVPPDIWTLLWFKLRGAT